AADTTPVSSAPQATPSPSSNAPSAAPLATVRLAVSPANAAVTVNGEPAIVEGGFATLTGSLGSRHHVVVAPAGRQKEVEVAIVDNGPLPASVALEDAPAPASPRRTRPSPAPGASAPRPAPPRSELGEATTLE